MSLNLLKSLSERDKYDRFHKYVDKFVISSEHSTILNDMGEWFESFPTIEEIDWEEFSSWFKIVKHPSFKSDKLAVYDAVLTRLTTMEGNSELAEEIIESLIVQEYGAKIADVSQRIAEGDTEAHIDDIDDLIHAYTTESKKAAEKDSCFVTDDLHEVLESLKKGSGLRWSLDALNKSCGELRLGDFIIFASRPDGGKTSFLASQATHMLPQMEDDQVVLWFNNEEGGKKIRGRIISSALGLTTEDMLANPDDTADLYIEYLDGKKIIIFDKATLHVRDIAKVLTKHKVGLIIIDQLRKVHGFEKAGNEVMKLQMLYQQGREWAKEYAPLITVHQADGTAEGQKWIEMNQLHGSKTDIQGEADAIITLGRVPADESPNARYLYIPKNKMSGEDPTLRNGKYEIEIIPEIARFKEP